MRLLRAGGARLLLWMAKAMMAVAVLALIGAELLRKKRTRTPMTEPDERTWDRAAVESGAMKLSEYIEKYGDADGVHGEVVNIPHRGPIG